jgi:hypothetical protein
VAAGSAVALVISTGPPPVQVPNVAGQTQSQAAATLNGVGLSAGVVTTSSSTTVPPGSVISQNPASPTVVPYGSSVALVVSSGPPLAVPVQERVLTSNGFGTRSTPAFTTSGPRLLVAFGSADGPPSSRQTLTVSGAGLQWTLVRRANVQAGASEIWVANAPGPLTNAVVSCVQQFNSYRQSLTVVIFTGATGVGASAIANARTGAPSVSLTTTVANSRVYAVGNDWDRAVARTLGPNQVMINQVVDTVVGDTFWVQARSTAVASAGTLVTINDTAPVTDRWNLAAVEIR